MLQWYACIGELHASQSIAPHNRYMTLFGGWCILLSIAIALFLGVGVFWLVINILSLIAIYEAYSVPCIMPTIAQFEQRAIDDAARRSKKVQ
jgi:hypothetical protein